MYPFSWPIPENYEGPALLQEAIPREDKDRNERRSAIYKRMQDDAATCLDTLRSALIDGRITASGRVEDNNGKREPITTDEWATLTFAPPSAYRFNADKHKPHPWADILIECEAVVSLSSVDGGATLVKQKRGNKN